MYIILHFDNGVEEGVHERIMNIKECEVADDKAYEVYEKIEQTLSDEQKQLFNEFVELRSDEKCIYNEHYFKEGVKIGMRLAAECFCE